MSIPAAKAVNAAPDPASAPIRVMLVDDSAVVRGMTSRWLGAEPGIAVVASCVHGRAAVEAVDKAQPDIIVLDIEMPEMDGLAALPLLTKRAPNARIVMASTLTVRNAEITLRALSLGATDAIAKPSSVASPDAGEAFRRELITKIRGLAPASSRAVAGRSAEAGRAPGPAAVRLRSFSAASPRVLCVGSSTGGPQALNTVLAALPAEFRAPILLTQHMPPTFTAILAQHLGRLTGRPSAEAATGMAIEPGHIYVAPGDRHLTLKRDGQAVTAVLSADPPEHFCRPAVDPMLRSAAAVYGRDVLAVILTGMGADGRNGAQAVAAAGGATIVQDEASSVVWGMPGAVAQAGLASGVYPLGAIAGEIRKQFLGSAR
jgi:two-component system chemotaxis response regulator CheB